ncbi:MAG: branched-chain amino acid ABC transporter permease [Chloroflexi bacterium]|nr:branched-chain amino acid ABC transporter permease [Chloroflexota bacterium]
MSALPRSRRYQIAVPLALFIVVLAWWHPYAVIEGVQRAGLYAAIALPMALILGIVGIVNLAHGDFLMLGAYLAYWFAVHTQGDPLVAILPAALGLFLLGAVVYRATIKHVIGSSELSQLLLTFGLAIVLQQTATLLWTSQPVSINTEYTSTSATIGSLTFGTYGFVYVAAAVIEFAGLTFFLQRTRLGQAASASGQNPVGARIVGINVDRVYLIVFSISLALAGAVGVLFLTRHAVFPLVGGGLTFKSFCLAAMAGLGNLRGILWCSLILGLAESLVSTSKEYAGWADLIFFVAIVAVILVQSHRRQVT